MPVSSKRPPLPQRQTRTRRQSSPWSRATWIAALCCGLAALAVSTVRAYVPEYSPEQLTHLSSEVVRGRVIASSAEWAEWPYGGTVILTTLTVETSETWFGDVTGTIDVVIPGGEVGDDRIFASCTPHLEVGDEAVLFLKYDLEGLPRFWVFGLERGTFSILPDGQVIQQGHDTEPMPMSLLRSRVITAANRLEK